MNRSLPQVTAVVLAGQRPTGDPLARHFGKPYKALVEVGGRSMLSRVVETLLSAPSVGSVVVLCQEPDRLLVGDTADLADRARVRMVASGTRIGTSVSAIAGTATAPWPILVTTADHPLLTTEMVESFRGGAGDCGLAVGLGERATIEAAYPTTRRTWYKFSDGHYSGTNLFLLGGQDVGPALALWSDIEDRRKSAWRLLAGFGPGLLLRAITRTISAHDAVRSAGRRGGVHARAVVLSQPEAVIDVDKLLDVELAEEILARREGLA